MWPQKVFSAMLKRIVFLSVVWFALGESRVIPDGKVIYDCGHESTLWVRGKRVGQVVHSKKHTAINPTGVWAGVLNEGDPVAVAGYSPGDSKPSCHISIEYTNLLGKRSKWTSFGNGDWRVRTLDGSRKADDKILAGNSLDHCHWAQATAGKSTPKFPGVEPIWGVKGQNIGIRTLPGVPNAGCSKGVLLAGAGRTDLFVNGVRRSTALNPRAILTHIEDLKKGDLVAIHSVGGGVSTRILTKSAGELGTKNLGRWRAATARPEMLLNNAFAKPKYEEACKWGAPVLAKQPGLEILLRGYAPAVWPKNSAPGEGAVFRMVVGGECTPGVSRIGTRHHSTVPKKELTKEVPANAKKHPTNYIKTTAAKRDTKPPAHDATVTKGVHTKETVPNTAATNAKTSITHHVETSDKKPIAKRPDHHTTVTGRVHTKRTVPKTSTTNEKTSSTDLVDNTDTKRVAKRLAHHVAITRRVHTEKTVATKSKSKKSGSKGRETREPPMTIPSSSVEDSDFEDCE